jgi:hypothetical protein
MSRLQTKPPAHKRGHPTLQNMNFFYFCGSFLPSYGPIEYGSNTDPDPDTDPDPKPFFNPMGHSLYLTWVRSWVMFELHCWPGSWVFDPRPLSDPAFHPTEFGTGFPSSHC